MNFYLSYRNIVGYLIWIRDSDEFIDVVPLQPASESSPSERTLSSTLERSSTAGASRNFLPSLLQPVTQQTLQWPWPQLLTSGELFLSPISAPVPLPIIVLVPESAPALVSSLQAPAPLSQRQRYHQPSTKMSMQMSDSMDVVGGRRTNAVTSHWQALDGVAQKLVIAVGVLFITCFGLVIAIAVANQDRDYKDDYIKKLEGELKKCLANTSESTPNSDRSVIDTSYFLENADWMAE